MILTVGNTKGGVGKTTIAVNLAVARAMSGKDILFIDSDTQGTAQTAISIRSQSDREPAIACASFTEGIILRKQVEKMRGKFQDIIIDVGARESTALRASIVVADLLLVPFLPRSFDVWALSNIVAQIREANAVRDGLVCHAFLNMADPTDTSDNRDAAETIADYPEISFLPVSIRRRKAFANAAGSGMSVLELARGDRDEKASAELKALYKAVFKEEI